MKATVDRDLCEGCGVCVEVCPEVFELDDEDKALVKMETVPSDAEDACRDAADQCPTGAITIEES